MVSDEPSSPVPVGGIVRGLQEGGGAKTRECLSLREHILVLESVFSEDN